jgi:hypothetical protein
MIRTDEEWIEGLDQTVRFLNELHAHLNSAPATVASKEAQPPFNAKCKHCGAPINWATTTANNKMVALDRRPGPYLVTEDGRATWQGSGGYACHYDKTAPDACPSTRPPKTEEDEDKPSRRSEWQDIYDN